MHFMMDKIERKENSWKEGKKIMCDICPKGIIHHMKNTLSSRARNTVVRESTLNHPIHHIFKAQHTHNITLFIDL